MPRTKRRITASRMVQVKLSSPASQASPIGVFWMIVAEEEREGECGRDERNEDHHRTA
jgi:hypothetical protein